MFVISVEGTTISCVKEVGFLGPLWNLMYRGCGVRTAVSPGLSNCSVGPGEVKFLRVSARASCCIQRYVTNQPERPEIPSEGAPGQDSTLRSVVADMATRNG